MTPLSTEDFPYTAGYVMELLALDERQLSSLIRMLGLSPRQDEETGRTIFTHRDIEQLKKAAEMNRQGEDSETIARRLGAAPPSTAATTKPSSSVSLPGQPQRSGLPTSPGPSAAATVSLPSKTTMMGAQDNIAAMVEAVSQVKEGILKDLSRLLDDKLAGLDEVVVELIRCKSENDSLKKKLNEALQSRESLEQELTRFKPVQFGFYRKL